MFHIAKGTEVTGDYKLFKIRYKVLHSITKLREQLKLLFDLLNPIDHTKELIPTELKLIYLEGPVSDSEEPTNLEKVQLL